MSEQQKKYTVKSAAKMVKGETFNGKYIGTVELQYGPGYELETDKGTVMLAGSNRLGYAFEKIAPGSIVSVTYQGKAFSTIKTGKFAGKSVEGHNFNIEVTA